MSHWKPSRLAIPLGANAPVSDRLETLREFNISRGMVGGIDSANRVYMTESEDPHVMAPMLARGMQTDYRNRGLTGRPYLVLQGGDTFYHTEVDTAHRVDLPIPPENRHITDRLPSDSAPTNSSRVRNHKVNFPERASVLGHNAKGQASKTNRGGFA